MEAPLDLRLLGPIELRWHGEPVTGFESRKALALVCYLATHRQPIARSQLTHLFWGDKPERNGRSNLSRVLHNNAALLPDCLEIERDTVQFCSSSNASVDVARFTELLERNDVPSLAMAVDLYRDTFMIDIALSDCPEFETWLLTEQARWQQQVARTLDMLINHYRHSGNYELGLHFALRLLALDPWREEAHRDVMLMLALSGQRSAALAQYEKCCHILMEELAVNPSAETTALYYRIRMGELRAKHISLPRIDRLSHYTTQYSEIAYHNETAPALVGLSMTATAQKGHSHQHRQLHDTMVTHSEAPEKKSEFEQIIARLSNPICRMLTLIGPNNDVQKRLLYQVMTTLTTAYRHGICFVPYSTTPPQPLLVNLVHSLNLSAQAVMQEEMQDDLLYAQDDKAVIWLCKQLRDKEMLLVFDNIDQYTLTQNRENALLFEELLKRAPMLKVLINARSSLKISMEWIFDLY
ncbi:MAG: bacterial transcriptional activator domain-containing protein [Caldilineaceae bacterium]